MRFLVAGLVALALALAWPVETLRAQNKPVESAAAQPASEISLPETLQVAVRQSPPLQSASIDVAVARASLLEASGIEDWVLAASGLYRRSSAESVSGQFTGSNDQEIVEFHAGISKLLFTGGTVRLGLDSVRDEATRPVEVDGELMTVKSLDYQTALTLTLAQPLLRGRGETAVRAAQFEARYTLTAQELTRQAVARTLIRDIVVAYWEVALAHRQLAIRQSSLDLARERRRLTESRVRLGNAAPTELNAVDQIIATREEEVLLSELAISERSLELRRLAGLEIGANAIDVRTAEVVAVKPSDINLDATLDRAYQSSPELAALEAQGNGAKIQVELTENGLLPRLDFTINGGPLGNAPTLSDSGKNLVEGQGYTVSAQLEFEYALGNNEAQGRNLAARERLRGVMIDAEDARRQIAVALVRSVKLVRSAGRRMQLSQTAIDLSEKNIQAEQRRFELGRSTNFDVLLRQDELRDAQLRYARAVVDYLESVAAIEALTGDIFGKYGITIEPESR